MKFKHIVLTGLTLITLACGLTACATGGVQSPPSKLDYALFNVQTNLVTQTNFVTQTNLITQTVTQTNQQNQVVTVTNFVPQVVMATNYATVTNYVYATKDSVTNTVGTVGAMAGPWWTVAALVLSLGLGVFAKVKSNQASSAQDVAGLAQQAIATAQNVIKAMPNGASVAAQFNAWLAAHQSDVDLAQEVAEVVNDYVDHPSAATAAAGIIATATQPIIVPAAAVAAAPVMAKV